MSNGQTGVVISMCTVVFLFIIHPMGLLLFDMYPFPCTRGKSTRCQAVLVQQNAQDTRAIPKGSIRTVIGGGSVSGLLAAHVLAPYCSSIHMVDKDDLLAPPSLSLLGIPNHSVRFLCTPRSNVLLLATCMTPCRI